QRKLFNALLFNAYHELPHKSSHTIQVRELCALIGYNSHDYGKLKKALLALITIGIEWNVINSNTTKDNEKWSARAALASAKFEDGVCVYDYSSVMKELLYQPEIYGRLNMKIISQFKSSYGLALYENCVRYQGLPRTPAFQIDLFRKLMGVPEGQYASFNLF